MSRPAVALAVVTAELSCKWTWEGLDCVCHFHGYTSQWPAIWSSHQSSVITNPRAPIVAHWPDNGQGKAPRGVFDANLRGCGVQRRKKEEVRDPAASGCSYLSPAQWSVSASRLAATHQCGVQYLGRPLPEGTSRPQMRGLVVSKSVKRVVGTGSENYKFPSGIEI